MTVRGSLFSLLRHGARVAGPRVPSQPNFQHLISLLRPGRWESAQVGPGADAPYLLHRRVGASERLLQVTQDPMFERRVVRGVELRGWMDWPITSSEGMTVPGATAPLLADLVVRRSDAKWLLFDLEQRLVLRLLERDHFSIPWEVLRRLFGSFVPSVPFEVVPGRQGIVEQLLPGVSVSASGRRESGVLETIEAGLVRLVQEVDLGSAEDLLRDAIRISAVPEINDESRRILELFGSWRLVPVHRDLTPEHVIVEDGAPQVIDFGGLTIGLPSTDFRNALLNRMKSVGPDGDREFLEFQERVGVDSPRAPDGWLRLLEMAEFALLEVGSVFAPGRRSAKRTKWLAKWSSRDGV